MEITIQELLKEFLPSNEIRQRFNNKQIKLNNEIVQDLKAVLSIDEEFREDLGDFIFRNIDRVKYISYFGNVRDWFGNFETNVEKFKFLGAYDLLQYSKKEAVVLLKEPTFKLQVESLSQEEEDEIIKELGEEDFIIVPEEMFYHIQEFKNIINKNEKR